MDEYSKPVAQILAGVNGAGKSTLYEQNLYNGYQLINPDVIARQIAPDDINNPRVSIQAGREALNKIKQALNTRQSFTFETTLSSHQALKTLQEAKIAGYQVILHYVGLADREISAERVAFRVSEGGHDIPNEALIRRYDKSIANLPKAMLLSDAINIYDNSGINRKILYQSINNQIIFQDSNLPAWAENAIKQYEQNITVTLQDNSANLFIATNSQQELGKECKIIYPDKTKIEQFLMNQQRDINQTKTQQSVTNSTKTGKNFCPD